MVDSLVKDIEELLFPNLPLKGKSLSFKKSFFSTQLVDRILAVRDLWIRCIYANTYRLAGASESLLAQFCLDSNESEEVNGDKILGWRCHTKGSEPYFAKFSSKNGKHYLFKKIESAKKSATDEGGEKYYHACNENCILATKDELIRVSKLLKSASSLDVRECRKAIQFADACRNDPEKMEVVYRLIVAKRNHPEACHLPDTACSSPLLLLRQLSVHYKGARELYRMANMMKIADQFLSDIDTATALGDIPYLLKLLAYKPPVAPKTFSVERPDELINGTTMAEKYGEHLVQFFNKNPKEGNEDNDLEEFLCETLDVEEGSVHNSGYSSSFPDADRNTVTPPNLSGDGDRTETNENGFSEVYHTESEDGSGLTEGDSDIVCLDNPEYIIANKRNKDPTEGNENSSWEELLCESSDSFNSSICSVKNDPTLSKKPFGKQRQFYSENNIDEESVHNIGYGSSFPDGDTVTPPNLFGNGDRTETNINGFSEIHNTESEDGSGLTEGDSDIVCLDNPEYIIANKRNKDPTEGIANSSWEELLCESSDSFNSSTCSVKDDPTLSKKPFGKQRQSNSKNKGGKPDDGFAHFAASEEFSFYDLGEVHEHKLFSRLWKEAALCDINSLESKCIESGTKKKFDDERRKQVTAVCITYYVKQILANELLHTLCLDSEKRFADSQTLAKCFHCQAGLIGSKNPSEIKGGNSNDTNCDDVDDNLRLSDEAIFGSDESFIQDNEIPKGEKSHATSASNDANQDDAADSSEEDRTRRLIEHMTEDDFRNLIEQYTVTGLENLKENPDLLEDLYQLLRLDEDPVDLDDTNLDLLAFPEIFSWGIGGKRGFREEKGTHVQYEETRMLSSNASSRRHIQYLFHLAGENERRKITRSIFSTIKFVQGLGSVDSNTLLQMIKNKDPKLLKRMTRVLKDVPNTPSYWNSQHAKLTAQIGKYGPPTFFATFSPSEYDWPELIEYLREANKDLPDVDNLTPSELMAKDPVLTSTFINQRFDALFDFIIDAKPLGEVYSYFIRHEYQSRGTVHFHTLLWIKDAPLMGKSSDEEISSFIQKYVSCRLPDQLEEPVLYDIVTKYQSHSCRSYCLRKFKNRKFRNAKKEVACRFGFPRPSSKRFVLHDVLSSVVARRAKRMRKRLYQLPRTEDERYINDYNPTLSFLWRGNMDIQFIAENSYAICNYITKYVTKSEASNIDFLDFKDLSKSTFQNLSKFAYACLRSREMGAHEAADRLLRNHGQMWRSSENFVWVQAAPANSRSRVMKNIKDLEGQRPDNREVFYPDVLHDFYPNRPRTDAFKDMTLYDFVTEYDKVSGPPKEGERYIRIAKQDGTYIRTMVKRKKTPVVYHNEYNVEKQPELFFYSMLCLFKPWRNESEIFGSSESCEKEFFKVVDQYPQLKEMAQRKIDIQKAKENMYKRADERIGEQMDGMGNSDSKSSTCYEYDDAHTDTVLDQGLEDYEAVNLNSEIQTENDLRAFVKTLNKDQMRVYNRITQHIEHMFDHDNDMCDEENCVSKPLFLYVSGFGGTGKSYLIKALRGYMYVQSSIFKERAGLILAAPTGLAAANINGQTIHSVLKLPVEHGATPKYTELKKKNLDQMRSIMANLKALIIDEISMVSNAMLMFINLRLQEVFGDSQFFGGKCVIAFGDLLQLPPVKGQPVFEELAAKDLQKLTGGLSLSLNLWRHFQFDELRINQRQAGTENSSWSEVLGRIRIGTQTPSDIELIKSRLLQLPLVDPPSTKEYLTLILREYERIEQIDRSVVCLLPMVSMVNEFNSAVMSQRFPNAKAVKSIDTIDGRTKRIKRCAETAVKKLDKLEDPRNTAGLEKTLHLCDGMRVMLRRNIDVSQGLVNGSVGTIIKIHDRNGVPERLTIQFDGIQDNLELVRDTRKIEIFPDAYLHRSQFPISVAYAITIHKAQGLSLSTVIADLGKSIFECGQVYVALSRCKTLLGLHLINFAPEKISVNRPALVEYKRLGSKPVINDDDLKPRLERQPTKKVVYEKVWYTSKNAKKAKSTIADSLKSSGDVKKPTAKKNQSTTSKETTSRKKKVRVNCNKNTGKTKPTGDNSAYPRLQTDCTQELISALVNANSESSERYQDLISLEELERLFTNVLIPWSRGCFIRGSLMFQSSKELDPDPLNIVANIEDKWLSCTTLLHCISDLQDSQIMTNSQIKIYNLGSSARTCYLRRQRRRSSSARKRPRCLGYIEDYVIATFGMQRITRNTDFAVRGNFSKEECARVYGDPLLHDIIIAFGNEGAHWYAIIIDNRLGQRKVVYFDSGSFHERDMVARCTFHLQFVNEFRSYYLRQTLGMEIGNSAINSMTHPIVDGKSSKQRNAFDCGVFALANAENYIMQPNFPQVTQALMKVYRCRYLNKLYTLARDLDIFAQDLDEHV
ncbi:hypothetical protein ACHWQZ_G001890 [Mnemiopsis leidyi]